MVYSCQFPQDLYFLVCMHHQWLQPLENGTNPLFIFAYWFDFWTFTKITIILYRYWILISIFHGNVIVSMLTPLGIPCAKIHFDWHCKYYIFALLPFYQNKIIQTPHRKKITEKSQKNHLGRFRELEFLRLMRTSALKLNINIYSNKYHKKTQTDKMNDVGGRPKIEVNIWHEFR